jgi:acetylornithine aminotransferase
MTGPLLRNVGRYDVTFDRGEGIWLYDTDGKRYMDMLAGIAVCALGHSHPALVDTLQRQAARLWHVSNLFYTKEIVEAGEALVDKLGPGRVFFCNSGTEANEAAIKLARKRAWRTGEPERVEIVAVEGSFHGRTMGSLAATVQPAKWEGFAPLPGGFTSVAFNDVDALDGAVGERTAAVIVEPVQGEGGVRPLTQEFMRAARALTAERGALLLCDEIQTGLGRTGTWWGYEPYEVAPDVVTLAKALGGGFPVGATWVAEAYADALQPSDHSTTQGGGPLACAVVKTMLDTIEKEGLVQNAADVGAWIRGQFDDVRGAGLLLAVELGRPIANQVVRAALDRGLIVNDVTPSAIRLAPPLTIAQDEAGQGVALLKAAIEDVG